MLRLRSDWQETGDQVQGYAAETGRNRDPSENDPGPCGRICEAGRSAGIQYLYHRQRRKRREYDVVYEQLSV